MERSGEKYRQDVVGLVLLLALVLLLLSLVLAMLNDFGLMVFGLLTRSSEVNWFLTADLSVLDLLEKP